MVAGETILSGQTIRGAAGKLQHVENIANVFDDLSTIDYSCGGLAVRGNR